MLREMSFTDFLQWQAYDQIEPIGAVRGDWQAASICSMMANLTAMYAGSKKRYRTKDFLLEFGEEREVKETKDDGRQSWQQQKMIAQMFVAMANAGTKRKRAR